MPEFVCFHLEPCSGAHSITCDGTGSNPSVTAEVATRFWDWMKRICPEEMSSVLDAGSGLGYLGKHLDDCGVEAVCVEGNRELANQAVYSTVICDLSKPIEDPPTFAAIAGFEMLEHQAHEEAALTVLKNFRAMTKYLFVSVHEDGPENDHHSLIRKYEWWCERFATTGWVPVVCIPARDIQSSGWSGSKLVMLRGQ